MTSPTGTSSPRASDLRALLDFVGEVHDACDRDEFRALVLPGVRRLVPADYASYNEMLADGRPGVAISEPALPAWAHRAWEAHAGDNPLIRHFARTRLGRPLRFGDVAGAADLRRSKLFTELYQPLGIEHQLAFLLPSGPELMIGVALSRGGRDFEERQRELLDLARPHLIQAYRNAELRELGARLLAGLDEGLEASGTAIVLLDPEGTVELVSRPARELLARLCEGAAAEPGEPLPAALACALGPAGQARVARSAAGEPVLLRRAPRSGGGEIVVLAAADAALSEEALRGLGLTPREAAVLHALATGLAPAAVASRLGISPRTVAKHLQRINAKLGVRDRSQAIVTAWSAQSPAPLRDLA